MKTMSTWACVLLMCGACSQNELTENENNEQALAKEFKASIEACDTRTYMQDGKLLRWTEDDRISLFNGSTLNRQFRFKGETGDNGGTFGMVENEFGTGNELERNYAVYPYNEKSRISEEGVMTLTLPATQSYAANSFGLGANTMVAVTESVDDTFLNFKNVGGYLKLMLYGDNVTVKSITLKGNNGEKIAGKASVTYPFGSVPAVAMNENATAAITLDCGEGVKVGSTSATATAFWLVVPPTAFTGGFSITIANTAGGEMMKSTTKAFSIERNTIKPMSAFELKDFTTSSSR